MKLPEPSISLSVTENGRVNFYNPSDIDLEVGENTLFYSEAAVVDAINNALEQAAQKVARMGNWTGGHGMPPTPGPEDCAKVIRSMKEENK